MGDEVVVFTSVGPAEPRGPAATPVTATAKNSLTAPIKPSGRGLHNPLFDKCRASDVVGCAPCSPPFRRYENWLMKRSVVRFRVKKAK